MTELLERIEDLQATNRAWMERMREAREEIDRLKRENEELRQQLAAKEAA